MADGNGPGLSAFIIVALLAIIVAMYIHDVTEKPEKEIVPTPAILLNHMQWQETFITIKDKPVMIEVKGEIYRTGYHPVYDNQAITPDGLPEEKWPHSWFQKTEKRTGPRHSVMVWEPIYRWIAEELPFLPSSVALTGATKIWRALSRGKVQEDCDAW